MPKLLVTLIDRCLFTLFFIAGVQVPEFMQQYMQRLSGHLHEANFQLNQFQAIADNQFQGDLLALVARYRSNSDDVFQQTGNVIEDLLVRIDTFNHSLVNLQQTEYLNRLYYFVSEMDIQLAGATLEHYQLAIPLEIHAITTGAAFAICLLLLLTLLFSFGRHIIHHFSTNNKIRTQGPLA